MEIFHRQKRLKEFYAILREHYHYDFEWAWSQIEDDSLFLPLKPSIDAIVTLTCPSKVETHNDDSFTNIHLFCTLPSNNLVQAQRCPTVSWGLPVANAVRLNHRIYLSQTSSVPCFTSFSYLAMSCCLELLTLPCHVVSSSLLCRVMLSSQHVYLRSFVA